MSESHTGLDQALHPARALRDDLAVHERRHVGDVRLGPQRVGDLAVVPEDVVAPQHDRVAEG